MRPTFDRQPSDSQHRDDGSSMGFHDLLSHIAIVVPLVGALCLSLAPWQASQVLATPAKPATDWSFYVTTSDTSTANTLGCNQGHFDASFSPPINSFVTLDFGVQTSSGGGTITTFTNATLTNYQVEQIAYQFSLGYYVCTGADTTSILTLGIGTNDSVNYSSSTYSALGTDWTNVINTIKSDDSSFLSQVNLWGANDIESWACCNGYYVPSSDANAWVNAYSNHDPAPYDNYGSADGCPTTYYQGGMGAPCGSGYHQYDYYYYSWGAPPALVTPEIYFGGMAQQWTEISLYGTHYQGPMEFEGPWDENDLNSSTLNSSQAWSDLWNDLNGAGVNASMLYSAQIHCEQSGKC